MVLRFVGDRVPDVRPLICSTQITEEGTMTYPFDFAGKSVFVAGGSSGINLGIADAFAAAGASVAIVSRSAERVATAVEGLRQHGAKAMGQSADVRDFA